jgi:anti-anti-sigma regulatory factor
MAPPPPFRVEHLEDQIALVALERTTLGPDAPLLAETLEALIADGHPRVVVDLSGAPLVNSKLLDALVRVSAKTDPRAGELIAVVTGTNYVRQLLEIGAGGGVLLVAATREEAVEALRG